MSSTVSRPEWAEVIVEHAAEQATARRLIGQLIAVDVASLAFCRLLERWRAGRPIRRRPVGGRLRCDARPIASRRR